MRSITEGGRIGGHEGETGHVRFSPDGERLLAGDAAGTLVLRSRSGEVLASVRTPAARAGGKPCVYGIAWSPDGRYVAAIESGVARLRRATDLGVVSERPEAMYGPLAFCNRGAALAIAVGTELRLLSVPDLAALATTPIQRRYLPEFYASGLTSDPDGTLVVTCDDGGREEDETCHAIDRDSPQLTLFDGATGKVLSVVGNELSYGVVFDPWRRRLYSVTYRGVEIWSPDGTLLQRWEPYAARTSNDTRTFCQHVAISAGYLVTVPDGTWRTPRTIDLWDPETYAQLATLETPNAAAWIAASPDGSMLVTPADAMDGDHGLWRWVVG
jgi:WD40 repeat protein